MPKSCATTESGAGHEGDNAVDGEIEVRRGRQVTKGSIVDVDLPQGAEQISVI